jgi:hypothetical protein
VWRRDPDFYWELEWPDAAHAWALATENEGALAHDINQGRFLAAAPLATLPSEMKPFLRDWSKSVDPDDVYTFSDPTASLLLAALVEGYSTDEILAQARRTAEVEQSSAQTARDDAPRVTEPLIGLLSRFSRLWRNGRILAETAR